VEYINDLKSGSSPKIRKAAQSIIKNKLTGYCPCLIEALTSEIEKKKAWQTQSHLIKAIGITYCTDALPLLNELIERTYEDTVLYRDLAFSILILDNTTELCLDFIFRSINKGNELQIAGACAAILYLRLIPSKEQITTIINGISSYTENEGRVITPRCYIAAVAHLWPITETEQFLKTCTNSSWPGLVEIAQYALQGKESKIQLV